MGVDWSRLVPEPMKFDEVAMLRYVEIINKVRNAGHKVMMTLFHHSIPKWANEFGGWTDKKALTHFAFFSENVAKYIGDLVDYWIVFNEPHVFAIATYCAGMWPPGPEKPTHEAAGCMLPGVGGFSKAMRNIAHAHIAFAEHCKKEGIPGKMGTAHDVGWEE